MGETSFGLTSTQNAIAGQYSLSELELRWFDHWLLGQDTGLMDEPAVKIFVMGTNTWRDENEWPLARAVDTPWFLRADGKLSPSAPGTDEDHDTYVYDPDDPVLTRGGATVMAVDFPAQAAVYTSEPLTHDLEVTGPVKVILHAATDGPSTDWGGAAV